MDSKLHFENKSIIHLFQSKAYVWLVLACFFFIFGVLACSLVYSTQTYTLKTSSGNEIYCYITTTWHLKKYEVALIPWLVTLDDFYVVVKEIVALIAWNERHSSRMHYTSHNVNALTCEMSCEVFLVWFPYPYTTSDNQVSCCLAI